MPVLLMIAYVGVWTLAMLAAVGIGHNLTARRGKRTPRPKEQQFDRLMHEYKEARSESTNPKRAR